MPAQAIEAGKFKDEIVPVEVKKKKETIVVDTDEGPRPGTTAEESCKTSSCIQEKTVLLQQVTHPESMMVQLQSLL